VWLRALLVGCVAGVPGGLGWAGVLLVAGSMCRVGGWVGRRLELGWGGAGCVA
jgi:hypothetical protein